MAANFYEYLHFTSAKVWKTPTVASNFVAIFSDFSDKQNW